MIKIPLKMIRALVKYYMVSWYFVFPCYSTLMLFN